MPMGTCTCGISVLSVAKGALNGLLQILKMHMRPECVMVRILHVILFASVQLLPTWKICMERLILGGKGVSGHDYRHN